MFATVRDDGIGFEVANASIRITQSIVARMGRSWSPEISSSSGAARGETLDAEGIRPGRDKEPIRIVS